MESVADLLEKIYSEYGDRIFTYCMFMLNNHREDAEDCFSRVFLNISKH